MRRLCYSSIVLFLLIIIGISVSGEKKPSVCFYYKENPPNELFYLCDWIVVDPDGYNGKKANGEVFAYVSVGEGEKYREYFKDLKKEWIIGENKLWDSVILDIRNPDYREFLITNVFEKLNNFDGFFLDTLDSYQIPLKDKKDIAEYEDALAKFIKDLKKNFPDKRIIINRGFEIYDKVKEYIDAVAVESLYYGLSSKDLSYREVPEEDRKWLLNKLSKIKHPIIVIDYLPPDRKDEYLKVSKLIEEKGFIPWVTDRDLNTIGASYFQLVPRKILLLYDSRSVSKESSYAHRMASLIFEYLGFVPEVLDVNEIYTKEIFNDLYAGIVVWLQSNNVKNYEAFHNWILNKIRDGLKVVFIDSFGFPLTPKYLKPLGISVFSNEATLFDPIKVKIFEKDLIGFEADLELSFSDILFYPEKGKPIIEVVNIKGQTYSPMAKFNWGGYGSFSSLIRSDIDDLWVVDPFKFFKYFLDLPEIPAPDTTTENGNRILFVHIDGDSFMERAEWNRDKFASEVIRDEIIKRYNIPHTVSVIEGEIAPWGLYPEISPILENIARDIFKLNNVEPASHSFSHPLKWKKLYDGEFKEGYALNIKDYSFDLKREIVGSTEYIQKRLLSDKKVKIFQWTGDCEPPPEALELTYKFGLLNINGGDTTATKLNPWLSHISPMGIEKGGYFQVYAAVQNENIYTNEWTGPYYGYQNVIQTFELTEEPKRLKPYNIYYHFYSGSKKASLNALKKVYEYVLRKDINPIYTSQWIKKVLDYRSFSIGKTENGWVLGSNGYLKTVRFDKEIDIDIRKSSGVVGYLKEKGKTYVHLSGIGKYIIREGIPDLPYIKKFNGYVKNFEKDGRKIRLHLYSYTPGKLNISLPENCKIEILNRKDFISSGERDLIFIFSNKGDIVIEGECK
ncbi:bifunctional glycoside hydrolase 114/ polysaccharide deacetylase family protein [Persephonella sp.]